MEAGPADPDSIARHFEVILANGSRFYPQTAAYQSLRSVGVDLIADDSVRVAITDYFEGMLDRVATAEVALWESYDRFLMPYVFERARAAAAPASSSRPGGGPLPRAVDGMMRDPSFPLIMQRIEGSRRRLLTQYGRTETQLDQLIGRLESVGGAL